MRPIAILFAALLVATGARAAAPTMADCAKGTPQAIPVCDALIKSKKLSRDDLALAYYNRAVDDQAAGQFHRAIDDFAGAIKAHPKFYEALFNRAFLLLQDHQYAPAAGDLAQAIALRGNEPAPHVLLAVALDNLDRHADALREFSRAIALQPADPRAIAARGASHMRYDEIAPALADFNAALKIKPDVAYILSARGTALRYAGRIREADRDFDRSVELDPGNADALSHRCWHRAATHRPLALALKDCARAVHLAPDQAGPYDSRGFLYAMNRRYDAALADYDVALGLDPRFASSLYGKGVTLIRMGQEAQGRALLAQAAAIDDRVAQRFARDGLKP